MGGFYEPDIPSARPQPLDPTHRQGVWTGRPSWPCVSGGMTIWWPSLPQDRDRDLKEGVGNRNIKRKQGECLH